MKGSKSILSGLTLLVLLWAMATGSAVAAQFILTPVRAGELLWRQDLDSLLGSDVNVRVEPVLSGDKVFIATEGLSGEQWVLCLDRRSGELLWQTGFSGRGAYNQGMAVADGKVFVSWVDSNNMGRVYALSEDNGKELWCFTLEEGDGWAGALRIKDGKIVFSSCGNSSVYALSEQDGHKLWRTPNLGGFGGLVPALADIDGDGATEAIFSRSSGVIIALNLADGAVKWVAGGGYWLGSPPILVNVNGKSAILQLTEDIGTWQKANLRCLDAITGKVIWDTGDIDIPKATITHGAAWEGKVIFGTCGRDNPTNPGALYAYDVNTGKLLWQRTLDSGVMASPTIIASGQILVKTAEYLYALSLQDGSEIWKEEVRGPRNFPDPPAGIADGGNALVWVSMDGIMYAFNLGDGMEKDWALRGGDLNAGVATGSN